MMDPDHTASADPSLAASKADTARPDESDGPGSDEPAVKTGSEPTLEGSAEAAEAAAAVPEPDAAAGPTETAPGGTVEPEPVQEAEVLEASEIVEEPEGVEVTEDQGANAGSESDALDSEVIIDVPFGDGLIGDASSSGPSFLEFELTAAKAALAKLQAEKEADLARLRTVSKAFRDLQSDNEDFRARTVTRGKLQAERSAFSAAQTFFDPVQNLKRSVEAGRTDPDSLLEGLEIVLHQFAEAMRKLGLEEVPGVGSVFDPKVHEALAVMPVADPEQDGRVLVVHNAGFMVAGKVLQAGQVVIGKYTASEEAAEA